MALHLSLLIIVKRALFAWLIADGDMHLKNMALLKIAEPGERQFRSVRMAPLYDAVTTRVFPKLKHDRMALKLNGKETTFAAPISSPWPRLRAYGQAMRKPLSTRFLTSCAGIDGIAAPNAVAVPDPMRKLEALTLCRQRIDGLA